MENRSSRRKRDPLLFIVLIALIALTSYSAWQLWVIRNEVAGNHFHNSQQIASLRSRIDTVAGDLSEIRREDQWYDRPNVQLETGEDGDDRLQVSWTFRELSERAEVGVHYRFDDSDPWREASVQRGPGLHCRAAIPLPDDLEPTLEINYERPSTSEGTSLPMRVEAGGTFSSPPRVEYLITATDGEWQKSGDREHADLRKAAGHFVATIREMERARSYSVQLDERLQMPASRNCIPSKVYFLALADGSEVAREELEHTGNLWTASVTLPGDTEVDEVGISLTDGSGDEFVRTISLD
ncbi:MAG: hypothetical protein ACOCVQ_03855 [Bacillota bacterium]